MKRLGAHPLHPALAHFPVALWTLLPLWDSLALFGGEAHWWTVGFWTATAGTAIAVPAAAAGLWDMLRLPRDFRGERPLIFHLGIMTLALAGAFAALLLRSGADRPPAGCLWAVVGIDAAVMALVLIGGWLGGVLVYRYGAGRMAGTGAAGEEGS